MVASNEYRNSLIQRLKMSGQSRNLLALAGVISTISGVVGAIPFYLQEKFLLATLSTVLLIVGIILLAIAFSD